MNRKYIGCENAASATDKIVIDNITAYFGDSESAGDWLNQYATLPNNYNYEWYERKTNWETGAVYKEWIPLEFSSTERIKAFANSIGVNL